MTREAFNGYNHRILRVNLNKNSVNAETIDDKFCRQYIGGIGFITYYLWKELKPGIDALSPDNILIFALGPVTGTNLLGSGRNAIGAKSPQGGGIALSEAGGFWGAELKRAGYDAIIIEGKADKPVYLWINDGEASIKDASTLWGKETKEAEQTIISELGDDKIRVALIGPAGEKLVRFACIMNGLYDAAGRGGLGAVMGSKNLKAIAVRGHKVLPIADRERAKAIRQDMLSSKYPMSELGTGGPEMAIFEATGNLPVRNFRDGLFPEVTQIHGGVIKNIIGVKMEGCFGCPVRCKKAIQFDEPYHVDAAYGGPEYETMASLGSNCGVSNLKAIIKGNERCNAYSLDTISTGVVIAFAMECFEKGLLSTQDTDGIELRFGNDEAMLKCIELIARRNGFGNLLAEGCARLAQKIGHGSEEFAMQVKGVEAGLHEPRYKPGMGLGYMINPHGADHVLNLHDDGFSGVEALNSLRPLGFLEPLPTGEMNPRKVAFFKFSHLKYVVINCLVMCFFTAASLDHKQLANITAAVTGWNTDEIEQLRVAERILTVARLFNIKQGFTAADDKLPLRYYQPKTDGALAEKGLDFDEMERAKRYYYHIMGWDADTGIPLPEKLEELGIT